MCPTEACVAAARRRNVLSRAFRAAVTDSDLDALDLRTVARAMTERSEASHSAGFELPPRTCQDGTSGNPP